MNSSFLIQHDFDFSPSPKEIPSPTEQLAMTQLMPQTALQDNSFGSSKVSQQMQVMGMNTQGMGFTPFGRIQLMNKLQQKFGNNYSQDANVKKLISMFDESLGNQSMDQQKSFTDTMTKAQRTLEALYRG